MWRKMHKNPKVQVTAYENGRGIFAIAQGSIFESSGEPDLGDAMVRLESQMSEHLPSHYCDLEKCREWYEVIV
jgi:hypothetical protein